MRELPSVQTSRITPKPVIETPVKHDKKMQMDKDADIKIINLQISTELQNLGIYEHLFEEGVTEIVINDPGRYFIEKDSAWHECKAPNKESDRNIESLGQLLINESKRNQKFDSDHPMLSLTMPGDARIQLVRRPAAEHASLTIRIPSKVNFTLDQYEKNGLFDRIIPITETITEEDQQLKDLLKKKDYRRFLELAIETRKNIVVSGATGSGKTTFMKSLLGLISREERIITIEDAREIFIEDHPNRVHLMYPKSASSSSVTAKSCLEATLRMKPDRIILAEVRGDEAFYFVRACGNGHSGSITSCHADSALMAYEQIALMINAAQEGASLSHDVIKRLIYMTIDVSIHFANHHGKRFITGVDFEPERKLQMLHHG